MNSKYFKRSFAKPLEPLQDLFIQILIYQYSSTPFSENDWKEIVQAYGQIFFKVEELWHEEASSFKGLSKDDIQQHFSSKSLSSYTHDFNSKCKKVIKEISQIEYNLNDAYIDLHDLNKYEHPNDVNNPVYSVFNGLQGNFPVVEKTPGIWMYNAIDIQDIIEPVTESFDEVFLSLMKLHVIKFLEGWLENSDEEVLHLYQKAKGEKDAVTSELSLNPKLIELPIDRVIYLIDMKYKKMNGDRLNKESIRMAVNRMKKA